VNRLLAAPLVAALLMLPTACGGNDEESDPDAGEFSAAADTSTCLADATAVDSFPSGYPTDFPLPPSTVIYHVEDRGSDGVIATGVTSTDLKTTVRLLHDGGEEKGFKETSGETEDHDAEPNWSGTGYTGSWAVRDSSTCTGEVVIQILALKG
jgi:hypothetical protein